MNTTTNMIVIAIALIVIAGTISVMKSSKRNDSDAVDEQEVNQPIPKEPKTIVKYNGWGIPIETEETMN